MSKHVWRGHDTGHCPEHRIAVQNDGRGDNATTVNDDACFPVMEAKRLLDYICSFEPSTNIHDTQRGTEFINKYCKAQARMKAKRAKQ